jgi:GT2 family glycosyltransferase
VSASPGAGHRRVSIVTASANGRGFLEELLPSLARQTFTDFEIIVVDNGSTDGTARYMAERWPEVRVLHFPEALGFAAAMNAGLDVARAPLVVVLNNDVVVEPRWLEELVACMDRHPAAGFCSSKAYSYSDPGRIDGAGAALTTGGWVYEVGHGDADAPAYDVEREVCVATAVSLMVRRQVLDEIGPFDESLGTCCEDADLTLRAFLAGFPGYYAPRSTLRHHRRGTVSRQPDRLVALYQRNMELVLFKNLPAPLLLRALPGRALFWAGSFALHLRNRQAMIFLRAKLAALRALPALRAQRARIQGRRRVTPAEMARFMTRRSVFDAGRRLLRLARAPEHYARTGPS